MKKQLYEIKENIYGRFDQINNMLFRYLWDKRLKSYRNDFAEGMLKNIRLEKEGYSHFDYAFSKASWTIYNRFPFAFSWEGDISFAEDWYGYKLREIKYKIKDIEEFTNKIKKAAQFYGASLVGITQIDERWVYKSSARKIDNYHLKSLPLNIPQEINRVIVLVIEMDAVALSTTPTLIASAANGLGYSKVAFSLACLGELIRNLGYQALQCGNDTALSIPLAIDAGLGALGRNGLLITPQYGSRVRIGKIFTDLPLVVDEPDVAFIAKISSICQNCFKCAEACENKAISFESYPVFNGESISNNSGVKKYYVSPEKCFDFWVENNSDCSTCITACPFSNSNRA